MHGHPKHAGGPVRDRPVHSPSAAVAWIDAHHAMIARTDRDGGGRVTLAAIAPDTRPYLARIVDEIGDRDRVLILGPDALRVELEREYVAIFRRPDRLIDVDEAEPADERELVDRLTTLTAE